jgi:hypothetical protein
VAIAADEERDDLVNAARARVEERRFNLKLTDSALREYVELYDRLWQFGRELLEIAERPPRLS